MIDGLIDFVIQLEEDLQRARCIMVDGDAAAFLPSKPQGASFCYLLITTTSALFFFFFQILFFLYP